MEIALILYIAVPLYHIPIRNIITFTCHTGETKQVMETGFPALGNEVIIWYCVWERITLKCIPVMLHCNSYCSYYINQTKVWQLVQGILG